eukprot:UN27755
MTDQPYAFTDSGVIPSLNPKCKHNIFPPRYLGGINYNIHVRNKGIDESISIFTTTVLDTFNNFILNKIITVNDKDAPWVTAVVKNIYQKKIAYTTDGNVVEDQLKERRSLQKPNRKCVL